MVSLKKARVLIVHSQPVMRFGLVALIRSSKHFQICAETGEAPVARRLFAEHRPDLVVLNLTLHHGDGIALIKDFKKLNPAARTLVVTARNDTLSLQRVFKAGARGYVVTQDETVEVLHALERIASGELYAGGTGIARPVGNARGRHGGDSEGGRQAIERSRAAGFSLDW